MVIHPSALGFITDLLWYWTYDKIWYLSLVVRVLTVYSQNSSISILVRTTQLRQKDVWSLEVYHPNNHNICVFVTHAHTHTVAWSFIHHTCVALSHIQLYVGFVILCLSSGNYCLLSHIVIFHLRWPMVTFTAVSTWKICMLVMDANMIFTSFLFSVTSAICICNYLISGISINLVFNLHAYFCFSDILSLHWCRIWNRVSKV